jgi:hypothetical protein
MVRFMLPLSMHFLSHKIVSFEKSNTVWGTVMVNKALRNPIEDFEGEWQTVKTNLYHDLA